MRRLSPVYTLEGDEFVPTFAAEAVQVEEHASTFARAMRCAVPAALIAAPLAFGATSVYAGSALAAAAWFIALLLVMDGVFRGQMYLPSHPAALPALLLLGFAAVHWTAGISVVPDAARLEWLRWLGYAALSFSALSLFDTPQRMKVLLQVLALAGFGVALLGIVQHLTAGGKIYWMIEPPFGGWTFGPYVNRNHFAGLMELWMPLALGLALVPGNRPVERAAWWLVAVTMSTAVVLSGSRAGLLVILTQFALFSFWMAARRGRRALIAGGVTLVVIAVVAFAVGGRGLDRFVSSIQPSSLALDEVAGHRIEAWKDTFTMFRQHWLIGTGLQSFAPLFPGVRTFYSDKFWSHAHNDILQFLAETGIAGAILTVWMFVLGARSAARNLRENAASPSAPLLAALACACLGFLMHGWFDFNFHVPANAANFAVLAAMSARRGWQENIQGRL